VSECVSTHPTLTSSEIAHTVAERRILAGMQNPFLVSLRYSFQTPEKLYIVLDYVAGGELFVHLQVQVASVSSLM
jgi:serum/glucocorticoid-regulated kinase 2